MEITKVAEAPTSKNPHGVDARPIYMHPNAQVIVLVEAIIFLVSDRAAGVNESRGGLELESNITEVGRRDCETIW